MTGTMKFLVLGLSRWTHSSRPENLISPDYVRKTRTPLREGFPPSR